MATTPPNPGNSNSNITLTISVDARTGQPVIQAVRGDLEGLGNAARAAGSSVAGAGTAAANSSSGWLKLYAQTELLAKSFNTMRSAFESSIVESTLIAARTEVLNTTLAVTAQNMNYTVGAANAQVQAIRRMNITHQESINLTLQMMRGQLELARSTNLARAAQDLAVVAGENSSQTANHLVEAILNQNVMMLRQYGIVTQQDIIFEKYAATLNRTGASLSTVERNTAFLNYILLEASKVSGAYTASMEDAGKKMTSLVRVFQDAREHVGERFLPAMNKAVDVLTSFGSAIARAPGWLIDTVGALTIMATTAGTLTLAVGGLAKAWGFVEAAAIAAAAAQGAAGATGVLGAATGLIKAHPILAGVVTLLSVGSAIYGVWGTRAEAHYKQTVNTARELLGINEQLSQIQKTYEELNALQSRTQGLRDGSLRVTEREASTYKTLTAAENAKLAVLEQEQELRTRQNALIEQARAFSIDLVKIEKDAATGLERRTLNTAKLLELQQKHKAQSDAELAAMQQIVTQRQQEHQSNLDRIRLAEDAVNALKQAKNITLEDVQAAAAWENELRKAREASFDTVKALKAAQAEQANLKSQASGLQLVPLGLQQTVDTLQTGFNTFQVIQQAQRQGLAVTGEEIRLVTDSVDAAKASLKDINKAVDAALEIKSRDKALSKEQLDLYRQVGDRTKKAYEDAFAANSKSIEGSRNLQTQLNGVFQAYRSGTAQAGRDLQRLGVDLGNVTNLFGSMLQFSLQARQAAVERANEATQRAQQELAVRQKLNQAEVQTYEMKRRGLDIERSLAAVSLESEVRQYALLGGNAARLREVLTAANQRIDALKREQLEQDRLNQLKQLELNAEQASQQASGSSVEQRTALLREQYLVQEKALRNQFSANDDLTRALKLLWARYYSQVQELEDARTEKLRSSAIETVRLQQQALQSGAGPKGLSSGDIEALGILDERRGALELKQFERSKEYTNLALEDAQAAEELLRAFKDNQASQHYAYIRQLEENFADTQTRREIERENLLDRAFRSRRGLTQLDVELRSREREIIADLDRLLRQGVLKSDQERLEIQTRLVAQLRHESDIRKINTQADAARQVLQAQRGSVPPDVLSVALERQAAAAEQARGNYNRVLEEFRSGVATFEELAQAGELVRTTMLSLPEVLARVAQGLPVDGIDAFRASVSLMGDAVGQAFQAMLNGQSAGAAFKAAIGNVLKASAVQSSVSALQELAAGLAALTPWGAAIYGPAPIHFKSAAMFAAAAAATGAAGAAIGGGGGAGGGGGTGGGGGDIGRPSPVSTRTASEDGIIRLDRNLTVFNRTLQYAGDRYNQTGANLFVLTDEIRKLSNSTQEGDRRFSSQLALDLARTVQAGFPGDQLRNLYDRLDSYLLENNRIAAYHLEQSVTANNLLEDVRSASASPDLPEAIKTSLTENLSSLRQANNQGTSELIALLRRQLAELEKANARDMTVQLESSLTLDGTGLEGLIDQQFVRSTSARSRQVAKAVTDAAGENAGRRELGRALSPTGGV